MILLVLGCALDPALDLDGDPERGATLFTADCALCHGIDAGGTSRGPALTAPSNDRAAADALDVVRYGAGDMPAYPELNDAELADLLAWLRTL